MKAVFMIMALALTGCSGWRVVGTTPASAEPFPESVRVTLHDGSRSILRKPLLRGDSIIGRRNDSPIGFPVDSVARIAVPLLAYFAIMWGGGQLLGAALGLGYERTTTLAFTAAGNNFELAIAVAIATYGATSGQALAGVVGPLIEVPVLIALVYASLALRDRFRTTPPGSATRSA